MDESCSSEANFPLGGQKNSWLTLNLKGSAAERSPLELLYTQTCFQELRFNPNSRPERVNLEAMDG
jgi:hypothetical protein